LPTIFTDKIRAKTVQINPRKLEGETERRKIARFMDVTEVWELGRFEYYKTLLVISRFPV